MQTEIAVVGGGVTGLGLCDALVRAGVDCLVLEADDRPGGVIRSERREGRVVDLGPQRTRVGPAVEELLRRLGLEDRTVPARTDLPLYVYHGGSLGRVPFGAGDLLRTTLLSPAGKLRLLAEPLFASPRPDESVARALRRKFGRQAYRRMLGPLFGGIYGSDPEEMPARYSLVPGWRALGLGRSALAGLLRRSRGGRRGEGGGMGPGTVSATFDEGMQALTDALYGEHRDRVLLGREVEALEPPPAGEGVVLTGRWGEVRARECVLTVPAPEAGVLVAPRAPGAGEALRSLRYNRLAVVAMVAEGGLAGYGYQISLDEEGFLTRGVTWNSSLFDRDGVATAYLGGAGKEGELSRPDDDLAAVAVRELERVTGRAARPLAVHRTRMPAFDESWSALERVRRAGLPPGVRLCGSYQSRPGIPGRLAQAQSLARELLEGERAGP